MSDSTADSDPWCVRCDRRVAGDEAHWLNTPEWRESRLCITCLFGDVPNSVALAEVGCAYYPSCSRSCQPTCVIPSGSTEATA
jgi:hypothetical protein